MSEKLYTIKDAKAFLEANWKEGVTCPCCTQLVKLYKRKLTSGMAKALINLYHQGNQNTSKYIHITGLGHLNGGEFAQLKRWGLIAEAPNDDTTKRTSGLWAITTKGIRFVDCQITVPSHVYTYDSKTINVSPKQTTIIEALGKHFNYQELMQNA